MILASSPQLKMTSGSQREKSTLDQGTPTLHSPLTEARFGMKIASASTMRSVPSSRQLFPIANLAQRSCAREACAVQEFSCAPGRTGKRGRETCEKVPTIK